MAYVMSTEKQASLNPMQNLASNTFYFRRCSGNGNSSDHDPSSGTPKLPREVQRELQSHPLDPQGTWMASPATYSPIRSSTARHEIEWFAARRGCCHKWITNRARSHKLSVARSLLQVTAISQKKKNRSLRQYFHDLSPHDCLAQCYY
jgi:hypothetical protein